MRVLYLLALLAVMPAVADNTNINIICGYGSDCGGGYYGPDRVNVFSDGVFDLSAGAPNLSSRQYGEEPGYNSAQRKTWINACRPRLQTSFAAFQACFQEREARNADLVRRQREAVNRTEHLAK